MDVPFLAYGLGLSAMTVVASLTVTAHPNWQLARATLVVFANWVAGTVFVLATDISDAWWFSLVIDAIAAAVILYRLSNQWQVALGLTYCLQIAMHVGYWLADAPSAWPYYSALTAIAWLQLLMIAGWCADIWIRQGARAAKHTEPRT